MSDSPGSANNRIVLSDFIEAFTGQSSDLFVEYIHARFCTVFLMLMCQKNQYISYIKYQLFEYGLYDDHI